MSNDTTDDRSATTGQSKTIPVGVFRRVIIKHTDFGEAAFSLLIPYSWKGVRITERSIERDRFRTISLFRPETDQVAEIEFSAIRCENCSDLFQWTARSLESIGYKLISGRQEIQMQAEESQFEEKLVQIEATCDIDDQEYVAQTIGIHRRGFGVLVQARCKSGDFPSLMQDFMFMLLSLRNCSTFAES